MSLVSSSRAGTCLADRAFLMAPLIFATNSGLKGLPGAIFKNKITRSSPSALYWGTQRLSDTSSNASTAERRGKERAEWRTRRQNKNEVSRWEARREEEVRGEESKGAKIRRIEKRKRWSVGRVWGNGREQKSVAPLTTSKLSTETLHFCCHYKEESVLLLHSVVWTNNDKLSKLDDGMANYFFQRIKRTMTQFKLTEMLLPVPFIPFYTHTLLHLQCSRLTNVVDLWAAKSDSIGVQCTVTAEQTQVQHSYISTYVSVMRSRLATHHTTHCKWREIKSTSICKQF